MTGGIKICITMAAFYSKSIVSRIFCRLFMQSSRAINIARFGFVRNASNTAKTPVQEFGYEYLKKQVQLGRPISPHLQIYKPQLTWLISGAHRIVGVAMSGVLLFGVVIFVFLPADFTSLMERLHALSLWRPVTNTLKFLVAFPIVFHTLNGIRFMAFDMAKGMELSNIYRSGYLVLILSTLLSLIIVANSSHLTKEQFQRKYVSNEPKKEPKNT